MEKNLPIYKISIKDNNSPNLEEMLGWEETAFVSDPAILKKGVAFNRNMEFQDLNIHPHCQCQIVDNQWKFGENPCEICKEQEKLWKEGKVSFEAHKINHIEKHLMFKDELKLRVAAPLMIPMNIYRFSDDIGEYEVQFDEDSIFQIVNKFMKEGRTNMFNLDHNTGEIINARLIECWFVENPETDKSKEIYGIEGLPKGTYFGVVQFDDKEFFVREIIEKQRTGFSIEGMFNLEFKNIIKNNKQKMEKTIETLQEELRLALEEIKNLKNEFAVAPTASVAPEMPETPAEENQEVNDDAKADEELILSIIGPKFDEVYKKLADLQSQIDADKVEEDTTTAVKMSNDIKEFNVFEFMNNIKRKK